MNWIDFPTFAYTSASLWLLGLVVVLFTKKSSFQNYLGVGIISLGIITITIFILSLWIYLERPPLRTLGETRLFYSLFMPLIGVGFYLRWKYKWLMGYAIIMTLVFLAINLFKPENYYKTLMPALQSPGCVSPVIVYIFGYAVLGVSTLVAIYGLYHHYFGNFDKKILLLADNLVYLGFGFLTLGLLFGALWAKQAWGHYWTWDPKETWAFLTWLGYLLYIHLRYQYPKRVSTSLWTLSLAFVVLLIAWFGINYLPSAQNSVHVYGS